MQPGMMPMGPGMMPPMGPGMGPPMMGPMGSPMMGPSWPPTSNMEGQSFQENHSNRGDDDLSMLEKRRDAALNDWIISNDTKELRSRNRRKRLNCVPTLLALFLPWFLFLSVYAMVAFEFHYLLPMTTCFIMIFISVCCLRFAHSSYKTFKTGGDWFYSVYMSIAFIVVVVVAWVIADQTFWRWSFPAINADKLAEYSNVDPSSHVARNGAVVPTTGKRYQDAGKIYFQSNSVLDQSKAMTFKLGHSYCVAPIVNPDCTKNCGYDFWAVGVDCCSDDAADFRCGEYHNPQAKSGIRMMYEWERPYFRLAVLEAEGAHQIMSSHPVFFYWMEDPVGEVRSWKMVGYKRFMLGMFGTFIANGCVLMFALKWRMLHLAGEAQCAD